LSKETPINFRLGLLLKQSGDIKSSTIAIAALDFITGQPKTDEKLTAYLLHLPSDTLIEYFHSHLQIVVVAYVVKLTKQSMNQSDLTSTRQQWHSEICIDKNSIRSRGQPIGTRTW
jgi:hypothetical protein